MDRIEYGTDGNLYRLSTDSQIKPCFKPCSKCHDEDCIFKGTSDTHNICEDFVGEIRVPIPAYNYDSEVHKIHLGEWKRIGYDIYECSKCGQNVQTSDIRAYKYCHGCGSKMKEVSE